MARKPEEASARESAKAVEKAPTPSMSRAGGRAPARRTDHGGPKGEVDRSGPLRPLLSGGDRRSVAQSKRAWALVSEEPERVSELAQLAEDEDWLVSMRAMDLLEKLAHEHVEWVQPHRALFIGPLAGSDKWEIRLQIVRALPSFKWTRRERERATGILRRDIAHPQKFVRAWALDSLATFAQTDRALLPLVMRSLESFERSGSKALAARAGLIRARLDGG